MARKKHTVKAEKQGVFGRLVDTPEDAQEAPPPTKEEMALLSDRVTVAVYALIRYLIDEDAKERLQRQDALADGPAFHQMMRCLYEYPISMEAQNYMLQMMSTNEAPAVLKDLREVLNTVYNSVEGSLQAHALEGRKA